MWRPFWVKRAGGPKVNRVDDRLKMLDFRWAAMAAD